MINKILATALLFAILALGYFTYTNPEVKAKLAQWIGKEKTAQKSVQKVTINESELKALVQQNMHTFALAVKQKNMTPFYNSLSDFWKERTTVEKLNETFMPFMKNGIDLTPLQKLQPIFSKESKITQDGDLFATGVYKASNATVEFKQTYKLEGKEWKLVAFFVGIKDLK